MHKLLVIQRRSPLIRKPLVQAGEPIVGLGSYEGHVGQVADYVPEPGEGIVGRDVSCCRQVRAGDDIPEGRRLAERATFSSPATATPIAWKTSLAIARASGSSSASMARRSCTAARLPKSIVVKH
jgi:hypothetical protein